MSEDNDLKDRRRVYYDHEPAYRKIAESGGAGWDDLPGQDDSLKDEAFGSYDALLSFLDSSDGPAPTQALELGCGGGQASLMLAERGFDVVGVDFSETAVELARANGTKRELDASFLRGDVTNLAMLEEGTFGLVIDNHCLHCLVTDDDRAAAIAEAYRVLRPGGVFFGETMSAEGDWVPSKMGVDPETGIDRHHVRRWVTEARLRAELSAAGFDIAELRRVPQEPFTGDCLIFRVLKPS